MVQIAVRELARSAIPIIDIADLRSGQDSALRRVASEMRQAAEGLGFFYIANHGIAQARIDRLFELERRFFHQPAALKASLRVNAHHRGFIPIGEAKMYEAARADRKESFVWGVELDEGARAALGPHSMIGRNQWPAGLPELKTALIEHLAACNEVGWLLLKSFAASLGVADDYFIRTIDRPLSRGSLVYYPPQAVETTGDEAFGVAPHTDYGCLTLVYQDDAGGLQIESPDGEWVMAPPVAGSFVVNVGDLLARWTNDRFKSTPHRVINRSGRERFSAAVFVDPNEETVIAPVVLEGETPHYEPVTCGAYIRARYDAAFAYRKKASPDEAPKP